MLPDSNIQYIIIRIKRFQKKIVANIFYNRLWYYDVFIDGNGSLLLNHYLLNYLSHHFWSDLKEHVRF